MPELPEVESLVRGVRGELVGKSFSNVLFLRSDIREPIPVERLKEILIGQNITDVTRRGKYMLIHTKQGILGVHLGMSGQFVATKKYEAHAPHTHAVFELDTLQFRFIDPRRFGRLFSVESNQISSHPFLAKLGVEPLDGANDLGLYLFRSSKKRSQAIKQFLMDSETVVGVGNIYASESLWRAKISPYLSANKLTRNQYAQLASQIVDVLTSAINAGGTTLKDYRDKDGNPGYFQTNLAVYGRDTKPCLRCSTPIVKTTQGARSTYHCPVCQKQKTK